MAESTRSTGRQVRKGASIGFLREQVTAVGNWGSKMRTCGRQCRIQLSKSSPTSRWGSWGSFRRTCILDCLRASLRGIFCLALLACPPALAKWGLLLFKEALEQRSREGRAAGCCQPAVGMAGVESQVWWPHCEFRENTWISKSICSGIAILINLKILIIWWHLRNDGILFKSSSGYCRTQRSPGVEMGELWPVKDQDSWEEITCFPRKQVGKEILRTALTGVFHKAGSKPSWSHIDCSPGKRPFPLISWEKRETISRYFQKVW